jgi:hypothetical protein
LVVTGVYDTEKDFRSVVKEQKIIPEPEKVREKL